MQNPASEVPSYEFFSKLARIINSGQARSIILAGNVNDLFFDGEKYAPLVPFLLKKTRVNGLIQVVYELNGPFESVTRIVAACARHGQPGSWESTFIPWRLRTWDTRVPRST